MQISLIDPGLAPSGEQLRLPDGDMVFYPRFLAPAEADALFQVLLTETPWQQDYLNFGGRQVTIPRLQAWYGDKQSNYGYSGLALKPLAWTQTLASVRDSIRMATRQDFNSVLLNYYRSGMDSVSWHSDNEKELGADPSIASLSLGITRRFELKHKRRKDIPKTTCELGHGSLLVMGAGMQKHWHHQVPKQPEVTGARINLTFRFIVS